MQFENHQTRRHFLAQSSLSVSSLALAWLLEKEAQAAPKKPPFVQPVYDAKPKETEHPAQAKAMISLWMQGGPSHHDMFDPKPEMAKYDGKAFPGEIKYDNAAQASSKVFHSPWKFAPRGECGMELSELIPYTSAIADDICLIRSMRTSVNNHGQSIRALQTGRILEGRPTLGSWLTYGLGCEADNLPAFMALIDPAQLPVLGVENWQNGFLPSTFQGTVVRPQEPRILDLVPPPHLKGAPQQNALNFLDSLNRRHQERFPGQHDLEARIATYELAAKMQVAATEALDLTKETKATQEMYGIHSANKTTSEYGTRCLIARRLIERGVRFVQVYTQNQLWDSHNRIISSLPKACEKVDQPSAALVADLKARGLLDSTVVHWGGEMGRLPVIQNDGGRDKIGRDHNTHGFSSWVAGGGFKAGHVHGKTDEWGHKAVEDVVNHYDYHATLLHLFGLKHDELKYEYAKREQTLTDNQPAKVIEGLLA
ncbi:DUF1501 domain-containing protein [Thalassoglobus polymorphus]|uniref:DUF1501 domain-containing protein n=1 Tax=Thalassoglobus polymorphus TaxID=2527994 RepID=A0A517QT30_9PLAN|nr:DUF1501 domain-containing protein [Thalassoglobus polymorphus]QDT34793.1 hypothetical protein Mal48_40650 [Thalassoglobus polymorphus]